MGFWAGVAIGAGGACLLLLGLGVFIIHDVFRW